MGAVYQCVEIKHVSVCVASSFPNRDGTDPKHQPVTHVALDQRNGPSLQKILTK